MEKDKEFKLSDKIITLKEIDEDQEVFVRAFGRKENTFVFFSKDVEEFIEIITEPLIDMTKPLKKKEYYKFIWKKAGDLKNNLKKKIEEEIEELNKQIKIPDWVFSEKKKLREDLK